ncbi:MAG: peptide deformylase [Deltaproteobacteria bacterium]|jgi:peptide deformylase|nr:peptide deformylase [Deltaproteobacteria bacterium]
MTVLPILKHPNSLLRQKSAQVEEFTPELAAFAEDMKETMLAAPGAGLAAPQVGKLIRMIVMDASDDDADYGSTVLALVNPEITLSEGKMLYEEGCLSVNDYKAKVKRFARLQVKAQDACGQPFSLDYEGRRAVILQHEIDHLDGVLFIDHLSRLKQELYNRQLKRNSKK